MSAAPAVTLVEAPSPALETPPAEVMHVELAPAQPEANEPSLVPAMAAPVLTTLEETTKLSAAQPPNEKTFKANLAGPAVEIEAPAPKVRAPRKPASGSFKGIVFVLLVAGVVGAYLGGMLDTLIQSPGFKAARQGVGDLAQPYLLKLADKVPAVGKWVSPIAPLDDVDPEDYDALKQAAMSKLEDGGPKLAVAPSNSDPFAPVFYVSSNLPDGAVIDVYLEGIPDTLLNQLSFSGKAQTTIIKKLGKTGAIHFGDGKPLPRGDYVVYATEAAQQPNDVQTLLANVPPASAKVPASLPVGLRLLASKPVFLGGAKDGTYSSRLKEFHDRLRTKANTELAEVKQLSATIEGQLSSTSSKYSQLRKLGGTKPSFAARKAWNDFNSQWTKLEAQLRESFDKWTDQALANDFFYGILYTMTKSAGDSVAKLHQMQGDFFAGKVDPKAFEIQRGSALSTAEAAVSALKNKISQAENLAPTPNGMPRREGL
jgi:hypothetical protein